VIPERGGWVRGSFKRYKTRRKSCGNHLDSRSTLVGADVKPGGIAGSRGLETARSLRSVKLGGPRAEECPKERVGGKGGVKEEEGAGPPL